MGKFCVGIMILFFNTVLLFGADGKMLAKKYKLGGSEKAASQWIRIFGNDVKMEKLGIVGLSSDDKKALQEYLVKHSADSDAPAVAGM